MDDSRPFLVGALAQKRCTAQLCKYLPPDLIAALLRAAVVDNVGHQVVGSTMLVLRPQLQQIQQHMYPDLLYIFQGL